ncbi:MAG TPA: DPP IV N-terminal domain-containing protein [bacterium]|nr:DPP IV N-terminal domain-containing protein [bacterium]
MRTTIYSLQKLAGILLVIFMVGEFSTLTIACKPKIIEAPIATPTPTPVPALGNVIFVQGGHLVEFNLTSSEITPLTSGKSTEWFPTASPKGDQVVYWSNADSDVYNLWKLNLTNMQRTQLTFNDETGLPSNEQNLLVNAAASWSPDGKTIIYAQDGDIWAIDSDGYNPKTILSGQGALCPNFSPDGKSVLYLSNLNDSVYNLYVLNQSDKTIKEITTYTDWNVGAPSYNSDGSKILYNLYRGDVTQVYTAKADGSEPINLTNNVRSLSPCFGQGDKKIYYSAYGPGGDSDLNIYIMSANGMDEKALTTSGGASPSWAPLFVSVPSSAVSAK